MAILGGSPLGLINVTAGAKGGYTSFNSVAERSIPVQKYNTGNTNAAGYGNSIFSGKRVVRAWPDISQFGTDLPGVPPNSEASLYSFDPSQKQDPIYKGARRGLHNNDVYDTSIVNIIEHFGGTMGELKMADFAYLKNLGVFPNNRLMIARRFATAIPDNIFSKKNKRSASLATLISWVDTENDYLTISFGEKWEDADASFTDILDSIGADISKNFGSTGQMLEAAGGAIPLPGFTEIFQRQFLAKIGVLEKASATMIPSGNPNLIKEAKRRTTIGYDTAGSGLECKVNIQMTCEYEQKFISGLDPTIVWMDILGNITRFGTSPSVKYGLSGQFASTVKNLLDDPMGFIRVVVSKIGDALRDVIVNLKDQVADKIRELKNNDALKGKNSGGSSKEKTLEERIKEAQDAADPFIQKITGFVRDALKGLSYKYRVRIMGVVAALSGAPSTPWHITIGNPLRPVFCAGDMYTQDVSLTLGSTLAFNDLPSSIKVTFTLANARPWGLQEIMAKFNSGYIRTVDVQKTFFETQVNSEGSTSEVPGLFPYGVPTADTNGGTNSVAGGTNSNTNAAKPGGSSQSTASQAGVTQSSAGAGGLTQSTATITNTDAQNQSNTSVINNNAQGNPQIDVSKSAGANGSTPQTGETEEELMRNLGIDGKSVVERQSGRSELSDLDRATLFAAEQDGKRELLKSTKLSGDKLAK